MGSRLSSQTNYVHTELQENLIMARYRMWGTAPVRVSGFPCPSAWAKDSLVWSVAWKDTQGRSTESSCLKLLGTVCILQLP